jgi:rhodanese-related sulfurtransferase
MDGDNARIIDPPNDVDVLPMAELMAMWDGIGIGVSKEATAAWPLRFGAYLDAAILLGSLAILVGLQWRYRSSDQSFRFDRCLRLVLWAGLMGISVDFLSDTGLLRHSVAVAQVATNHFEIDTAEVDSDSTYAAMSSGGAIIDARLAMDYRDGHIPGAKSLPVVSGLVQRSRVLSDIDKTRLVIVYCQSDRCTWAKAIAADLYYRGYRNLAVFKGGFHEWQQRFPDRVER